MPNITLICTVHKENGKCNADELYKMIKKIQPNVIFQEIDYYMFTEKYEEQSRTILEINVIKKYLENHQVEQIPVDHYPPTAPQEDKITSMLITAMIKSQEYRSLLQTQFFLEKNDGFAFLNSDECNQNMKKTITSIKNFVEIKGNEKFSSTYKFWLENNELRERNMIENIYEYSSKNEYDKAIFLVGSGHRKSVIDIIQEYNVKQEVKLNWVFDSYESV